MEHDMTRSGAIREVKRTGAESRSVGRVLLAGIAAAALAASGCSGSDGGNETLGTALEETTYDSTPKPIPTSFLKLKTTGNRCCTGAGATFNSCSSSCADANGLVTVAGADKAADYYKATGQDALTTFDAWKEFFGFPKRLPGEALDTYRQRANVVVYYNRTELGLGRELGCAKNSQGIACYVSNYGDRFDSVHDLTQPDNPGPDGSVNGLRDAVGGFQANGLKRKNTVVISYVRSRESTPNDGKAVQFAAFKGDGTRLNTAQLDTMGARPIPQICMTCHGGVWDADATTPLGGGFNGIARYARFLPLITSTVTFSGLSPYKLSQQEERIRVVNEFAWKARGEPLVGGTPTSAGSLTPRQMNLMRFLYATTEGSPTTADGTLGFHTATPGRQFAENAWPGGWSSRQAVYNVIALPYCDTCHMAMEPFPASGNRPGQSGLTYAALDTLAATQTNKNTLAAFMGVTTAGFAARSSLLMPHAQNAFARFWGDASTFDGSCFLNGAFRPKAECFLFEIGFWPNGRPAGATFSPTNPLSNLVPVSGSSGQADCGQANLIGTSITSGVNSGRRTGGVFVGGSTFVNQCFDGCVANEVYCPGSETASNGAGNQFPNVRTECRPVTQNIGQCAQCGRLYQPICQQVGSGCRQDLNPNCQNLPACHEGVSDGTTCWDGLLSPGRPTAQSSTAFGGSSSRAVDGNRDGTFSNNSVTHTNNSQAWWRVDLGATKKITWIDIYNRTDCCSDRLANFVVEYSTSSAGPWTRFSGGDFSGVTPTTSQATAIALPKPVSGRFVRIRLLSGSILSLAEVDVWGF
jgi:hypothetical protein